MASPLSKPAYDLFISYKREEESWASRIEETLRGLGLRIWRDRGLHGIRPSERWSEEIAAGIRSSRAMLVLWSKRVKGDANSVVHEEIRAMAELIRNDKKQARRFVSVQIDGTPIGRNPSLAPYQAVDSFQDLYREFGASGADRVGAVAWCRAMRDLIAPLGIADVTEVRYVVAAMTRSQAEQLRDAPEKYAYDLGVFQLMQNLMGRTSPYDVERYGPSPDDWRPLPQLDDQWTIRRIIEACDREKRLAPDPVKRATEYLLASCSDELVSPVRSVRENARYLVATSPCVVFVDPVSMVHKDVYDEMSWLLGLPEAFVIGIAPYVPHMHAELLEPARSLEQVMERRLHLAYDRFCRPFAHGHRTCVLNVEQEFSLFRWFQVAADTIATERKTPIRGPKVHESVLPRMRRSSDYQPGANIVFMGSFGGNSP